MEHGGNVIEELTEEHREMEALFDQVQDTAMDNGRRRELADRMTIELVRHAVAEEDYLYPAVRTHLKGGRQLADKEMVDHALVERLLKDLEDTDPGRTKFEQTMIRLVEAVNEHVRDEEDRLFPMLQAACSSQLLQELGEKVRAARAEAPTHPHPAAPAKPPADKLLGPGAGLVDRARDMLTGRGR
ncbi:hemerythrin domain-containing protein [Streptomyces sp. NPDC096176]|uniref:hemerythrin domain-containing protein n=1 Tax=Streptomyces sp. NPDC096176 TaxID=3366079 RepID=UPI0037F8B657